MVHQIGRGNGLLGVQANDANSQRRPASITTFAGGTTRWTTGAYAYDGAGNVTEMGDAWFLYDKVSRLVSAKLFLGTNGQGTQVQQSYTFDPFGNLTQIAGSVGRSIPTTSSTNRITTSAAVSYDASGNLTTWNGASYVFDAFNQMERMTSGSVDLYYLYTADDERFWTYNPAASSSRWTLRDLGGLVLREYTSQNTSWSLTSDYIYRDGLLLAAETPGGVRHFHLDHLGTPRLITNGTGQQAAYHVYYPFGEEATGVNQDAERMKFTGHERDLGVLGNAADDLDYMHARHYSPLTGRFLSVDPVQGETKNPRSWNLYNYVFNRPSTYTDPQGLTGWRFNDSITVVGDAGMEGLASLVWGRVFLDSIQRMSPEWKATAALSLMLALDPSIYQGKPLVNFEPTDGLTVAMMPLTPGSFAGGRLFGRNPRVARTRINTDLPGGRSVAKSIFQRLTRGQKIKQEVNPNGSIRRSTLDDSVQIRLNPDGTTRIDIRGANSFRDIETIHFD
jgi:RHS repeat-associated protein